METNAGEHEDDKNKIVLQQLGQHKQRRQHQKYIVNIVVHRPRLSLGDNLRRQSKTNFDNERQIFGWKTI